MYTGRSNAFICSKISSYSSFVSQPLFIERKADAAQPTATHAPWDIVKIFSFSTACPMVCPRFKTARSPCSVGSFYDGFLNHAASVDHFQADVVSLLHYFFPVQSKPYVVILIPNQSVFDNLSHTAGKLCIRKSF